MPEAPIAEQLPDGRYQTTMDGITYRWRMGGGSVISATWEGTQKRERPLRAHASMYPLLARLANGLAYDEAPPPQVRRDGGWYRVTFSEQERAYPRDYRWKISSRDAALPIEQRVYAEVFCGTWGADLGVDILYRLWALTPQEPAAEQQELFG